MTGGKFLLVFAITVGLVTPTLGSAATPCPPSPVSVSGGTSATTPCGSYTTNFPLTEDPISEGGRWTQRDPYQTGVKTEVINGVHVAHGTMASGDTYAPYDDSQAGLTGFDKSHTIQGTVWKASGINNNLNAEVELRLSYTDNNSAYSTSYGNTTTKGYEININQTGFYMNLGRFKRNALVALGQRSFTPKTGDIFKAQIVYNADNTADITCWWNGVQQFTYHDTTPEPPGNPGIGFYTDSGQSNNVYGFSSITATSP